MERPIAEEGEHTSVASEVSAEGTAATQGDLPEKLTWSVRPCTMNRKKCIYVSLVILLFGFAVLFGFRDFFLAALSVVILVGSLHSYYFETHYALSPEGIEIRALFGSQRKTWTGFKSFWVDKSGLSLSPFTRRSWLEHYRGVRLLFNNNRHDVVQFVTMKLGKEAARGQRVTPVS
jgi:hypothetical protein